MLEDIPTPLPTAYYNQMGDAAFRKQPMAAGAFKFVSQQINVGMTFERFDDFWDKSRVPNFKTMKLLIVPDESTRVAGLEAGSLDIAASLSAASAQQPVAPRVFAYSGTTRQLSESSNNTICAIRISRRRCWMFGCVKR